MELIDRYEGCLLGLACGDAVGTTVEFRPRGSFALVTGMAGGGPFALQPGQWTDDTSMALCLAESLLACGGFAATDQMRRYVDWWRNGHLSSTGECFDIGGTVRSALRRFVETGEPFSGDSDPSTAGNGSLMRLAAVPLFYAPDIEDVARFSADSSRTTHGAPEAVQCCQLLALAIARSLSAASKAEVLDLQDFAVSEPKVAAIGRGEYRDKPEDEITGSGYCVESLEAAFSCFDHTGTFEGAVLTAVNLGDDADTTAAIVGQIAGAYYGVSAIPRDWLGRLHMRDEIMQMARNLFEHATTR